MSRKLLLAAAIALLPTFAEAKAPAVERTEKFIDLLLRVKQAPDNGKLSKADQDANKKIFAELDGFFDWDYLTQEPIAPRADKFSAAERNTYDTYRLGENTLPETGLRCVIPVGRPRRP